MIYAFLHNNRCFSANSARDCGHRSVRLVLAVPVKTYSNDAVITFRREGSCHAIVDANVIGGPLRVGSENAAVLDVPRGRALVLATNRDEDRRFVRDGADRAQKRHAGVAVLALAALEDDDVHCKLWVFEDPVGVHFLIGKAEVVGGSVL